MILLSLKHPSACVVARFEEVGIMGEFVVFPRADNGYDIETDVGEEAAGGAGKGVGGVDDVLFFLTGDGLERCGDGFFSPCLYLYDNEDIVLTVVCNDIEVFMSIMPIAGEDGIALLKKVGFSCVLSPFAELVMRCHGFLFNAFQTIGLWDKSVEDLSNMRTLLLVFASLEIDEGGTLPAGL